MRHETDNDTTLDQIMTPERAKLGPDNNFTIYLSIYLSIYLYIYIPDELVSRTRGPVS